MSFENLLMEYSYSLFFAGLLFGGIIVFLLMLIYIEDEYKAELIMVKYPAISAKYPAYNQALDVDSYLHRKTRKAKK